MFNRPNLPKQLQTKTSASTRCQKCLKLGHATYECKNARPYTPRPSRSKELASARGIGAAVRDTPSVQVPEEFRSREGLADRILRAKEEERKAKEAKGKDKGKGREKESGSRRRRYSSSSGSDSGSDLSRSDSDSESEDDRGRRESDSSADSRPRRRTNHTESRSRSPPRHAQRRYSTTKDRSPAPREPSGTPPRRR